MSEPNAQSQVFHLGLTKERLRGATLAIVPGDPARSPRIAELMQKPQALASHREFNSWLGELDGKPVVGFEIRRTKGASEVSVAKAVRQAVAKLNAGQAHVKVQEAFNAVEPVQDSYDGSMTLLYEGAILAVIVVWLFLRDWRATLVTAAANRPYFSIDDIQSTASGLPVFSAGGGLRSVGAGAQARYFWTPQVATHVFVEYDRLTGDVADSPRS